MVGESISIGEDLKSWITQLVQEIGPRWAGSPAEAHAAERIRSEFEKTCNTAEIDSFEAHPRFPETSPHILTGFYGISLVCYPLSRWLAFGVMAFGLIWYFLDNVLMLKFLDPIFSLKRIVTNVRGTIHSREEKRNLLIFSAHHDSPNCYRLWDEDIKGKKYIHLSRITESILYAYTAFTLFGAITGSFFEFTIWRGVTFVDLFWIPCALGIIYLWWFCKLLTPYATGFGANDNLSGVSTLIGLSRILAREPPRHTEVWLVSFGAEERGFKGSLHFARKYKKQLKAENAMIINVDEIGGGVRSTIHKSETYYMAKLSDEAAQHTLNAAKRVDIDVIPFDAPAGGTDAAALARHGLKVTSIVNQGEDAWVPMWHNDTDRPENIDPVALGNIVRLLQEIVNETERL
jgi:hypothetical protein